MKVNDNSQQQQNTKKPFPADRFSQNVFLYRKSFFYIDGIFDFVDLFSDIHVITLFPFFSPTAIIIL